MNILIVGDCNHILMKDLYLNNKFENVTIDYCTYSPVESNNTTTRYYNITNYSPGWIRKIIHPFILYYIYLLFLIIIKGKKYQIIHFHFTYIFYLFLIPFCKFYKIKIISTIWGSDFYHANKIELYLKIKFWKKTDIISITNENLKDILVKFGLNKNKINITRFGLSNIENIDTLLKKWDKNSYKKSLNIPTDKKIVMVGYNRSANQNHEIIINSIQRLDKDKLNQYFFVFPLTYGPVERLKKISSLLKSTPLNYIILSNMLSMKEFSKYTISTDIFVQLQNTDQLSATMTEHIYCGNSVITGSWLNYNILREKGAHFFNINSFDELSIDLSYLLCNCNLTNEQKKENKKVVFELCHWKENINSWKKLYLLDD